MIWTRRHAPSPFPALFGEPPRFAPNFYRRFSPLLLLYSKRIGSPCDFFSFRETIFRFFSTDLPRFGKRGSRPRTGVTVRGFWTESVRFYLYNLRCARRDWQEVRDSFDLFLIYFLGPQCRLNRGPDIRRSLSGGDRLKVRMAQHDLELVRGPVVPGAHDFRTVREVNPGGGVRCQPEQFGKDGGGDGEYFRTVRVHTPVLLPWGLRRPAAALPSTRRLWYDQGVGSK